MTTQEFVNYVKRRTGDALNRQSILEILNNVQNEILAEDCQLMRIKPDPFITTADDIYEYTASSSLYVSTTGAKGSLVGDIRTVRKIYSFDNSVDIFNNQTLDPSSNRPAQIENHPSGTMARQVVDVLDSISPSSSDCTIRWFEGNNPGDNHISWGCVAYKWPAQLVSENIALSLPSDFQANLLFWGVMKEVQTAEYARTDHAYTMYETYLKRFRVRYNHMARQVIEVCYPRDF